MKKKSNKSVWDQNNLLKKKDLVLENTIPYFQVKFYKYFNMTNEKFHVLFDVLECNLTF